MTEPELRVALKHLIVESLRLEDIKPDAIADDALLFSPVEGLGLDSLSALELLSAIEFKFNVTFGNDPASRDHFKTVGTLAAFVYPRLKN